MQLACRPIWGVWRNVEKTKKIFWKFEKTTFQVSRRTPQSARSLYTRTPPCPVCWLWYANESGRALEMEKSMLLNTRHFCHHRLNFKSLLQWRSMSQIMHVVLAQIAYEVDSPGWVFQSLFHSDPCKVWRAIVMCVAVFVPNEGIAVLRPEHIVGSSQRSQNLVVSRWLDHFSFLVASLQNLKFWAYLSSNDPTRHFCYHRSICGAWERHQNLGQMHEEPS